MSDLASRLATDLDVKIVDHGSIQPPLLWTVELAGHTYEVYVRTEEGTEVVDMWDASSARPESCELSPEAMAAIEKEIDDAITRWAVLHEPLPVWDYPGSGRDRRDHWH
jgi:hypothetical protein